MQTFTRQQPLHHQAMIIRKEDPFNAGPPSGLARNSFITPTELFFVRNHGAVPEIDPSKFRLSVSGLVRKPLSLSLGDIQNEFPKVPVVATLQCAGNRRKELARVAQIQGEVPWDTEAISNATWGGISVRLLLDVAGVSPEAAHIEFTGLDEVQAGEESSNFGGSIPRHKASGPEVIIAYEMNGEPLPADHGYPLRMVVPGYIGARSVKWLGQVTALASPSENYFQAETYKLYPPWVVTAEDSYCYEGLSLGEQRINSVICRPRNGEIVSGNVVRVKGHALAGNGRRIERVEVSPDRGKTWKTANLLEDGGAWAWRFWQADVKLRSGPQEIAVRAWDSAFETQPADPRETWNFKGYMNNAWHRIEIEVQGD